MKTIPIWNSIKTLSLKWLSYSLISTLALGCNRKPEACVTAQPTTVRLGEIVTISDCSERSFNNELKTGEGASFSDISIKNWAYFKPGTYTISLKAFSKRGNKDDISSTSVSVKAPEKSELKGNWKLTHIEEREQLFVDPNLSIYENSLVKTDTIIERYTITSDSLFVQHESNQYVLFLNEYAYQYDSENAELKIGDINFDLVEIQGSSMVWKGYYFKGYSLLYLSRL